MSTALAKKKPTPIMAKVRNHFYRLVPRKYRLAWEARRTDREYKQAIQKARVTGNREDLEYVEWKYRDADYWYYIESEKYLTTRLLQQAHSLRVHTPPKPKFDESRDAYEENDDWEQSQDGDWYLTNKGIEKVKDGIDKEKKRKRERWQFAIQCATSLITIIGALSGWIAFFLK